jgi:hypothetical protein
MAEGILSSPVRQGYNLLPKEGVVVAIPPSTAVLVAPADSMRMALIVWPDGGMVTYQLTPFADAVTPGPFASPTGIRPLVIHRSAYLTLTGSEWWFSSREGGVVRVYDITDRGKGD